MAYTSPSVTQSGWSFAQFQAGGTSGLLEKLISVNTPVNSAPAAAPTCVAASGGTLPNANYYITVTETDGFGETTNGGKVSSGTAANAQKITVTFQALQTGNTARNVYIGTSATGPFMLVARGITASTYDITALPTNSFASAQPPSVNTAGIANVGAPRKMSFARSAEKGNLQDAYRTLRTLVSDFNSGKPIDIQEVYRKVNDVHVMIKLLDQLCVEVGTLLDANPGTVKPTQNGAGVATTARVWP